MENIVKKGYTVRKCPQGHSKQYNIIMFVVPPVALLYRGVLFLTAFFTYRIIHYKEILGAHNLWLSLIYNDPILKYICLHILIKYV